MSTHITCEYLFICVPTVTTAVASTVSDVPLSRFDDRSADTIVPLADLFRLLGDPTRLRIVLTCVDGRRPVGAIAEALGLSPSLVSHHLRLLRAARIVRAERQGKQVFYLAADRHISAMLTGMLEHVAEPASDFPVDAT
ncbi:MULTISPECIES: ArsR/SmtB family transcription factor [Paraburkholderia]|uniref:Metalloregulator ArsR/SmtB family transcription factor n=1 Tax=Paraburkholderia dilworthii TaxID=948106 RepID=A0ABW9D9D4_9BURK|nr:metalloregulator ArsR/SmtB family transcription factor [Paraburkholderia bryophila]